jgi:hypothetical protein
MGCAGEAFGNELRRAQQEDERWVGSELLANSLAYSNPVLTKDDSGYVQGA